MTTARYAVHPGAMSSKNDRDVHYIGASQLMRLYGVDPRDCIIIDDRRPETYQGRDNSGGYIHLYPDYHGNYELPKEGVSPP